MTVWLRVNPRRPCPVCAGNGWCGIAADGTAAVCMRVKSAMPTRNGGFLHRLRDCGDWTPRPVGRVQVPSVPLPDFGELAARYAMAVADAAVTALASQLKVGAESLRRLGVGWDGEAWTFPMTDPAGRVVGIRRRFPNGRKLSIKGGHEGLFLPTCLPNSGPLYIGEGPTDTAALLTIGLDAVGRPSCTGGVAYLVGFARGRAVVIVADGDDPGIRGAVQLAVKLRSVCPSVSIIVPPSPFKDARQWIVAGATRTDIESTLTQGPVRLVPNAPHRATRKIVNVS